jgi:hypothetical protein
MIGVQRVEVAGKWFVFLPEVESERLSRGAGDEHGIFGTGVHRGKREKPSALCGPLFSPFPPVQVMPPAGSVHPGDSGNHRFDGGGSIWHCGRLPCIIHECR